jgi:hypothetical protein
LVYFVPNHENPGRPNQKGGNISEWKKAYSRAMSGEDFSSQWFEMNVAACCDEGDCNFTTSGAYSGCSIWLTTNAVYTSCATLAKHRDEQAVLWTIPNATIQAGSGDSGGVYPSPRPASIDSASRSSFWSIRLQRHPWYRHKTRGIPNDQNDRGGATAILPLTNTPSTTTNRGGGDLMEIFGVFEISLLTCAPVL